jgi:PAS domain-containing protein
MGNELRGVVDALPELVWMALPDGYTDFFNQRWCKGTSLSARDANGQRWPTAIHPEGLRELAV